MFLRQNGSCGPDYARLRPLLLEFVGASRDSGIPKIVEMDPFSALGGVSPRAGVAIGDGSSGSGTCLLVDGVQYRTSIRSGQPRQRAPPFPARFSSISMV
jgi:hypothetical protein